MTPAAPIRGTKAMPPGVQRDVYDCAMSKSTECKSAAAVQTILTLGSAYH